MNIFIGWSGSGGLDCANALGEFLTDCLSSHVQPLISVQIKKGEPWRPKLNDMLVSADCAIFCITQDSSPAWICYEAGVLSQRPDLKIIPLVFQKPAGGLFDPLSDIQVMNFNSADMKTMMLQLFDAVFEEDLKKRDIPLKRNEVLSRFDSAYAKMKNRIPYTLYNFLLDLERIHEEAGGTSGYHFEDLYQKGIALEMQLRSFGPLLKKAGKLEEYRRELRDQSELSSTIARLYENTEILAV